MKKIKIQSGNLKGKTLPASPSKSHKENFTPALLKKTVFSIIENLNLRGIFEKDHSTFIDLFAGSGQMGFEAISRGYSKSILFEIDPKRFSILAQGIAKEMSEKILLLKRDSFRYFKNDQESSEGFYIFFGDPPYSFWETRLKDLHDLSEKIIHMYDKKSIVIFQSPMNPCWKNFISRKYGNHYLLIHAFSDFDE